MKEHKGMRPQDVIVMLKMISFSGRDWYFKDIAREIQLSNSEVSESVYRSMQAGLIEKNKREVARDRLLEFLVYGLRYVYPVEPGRLTRGMPTAHSCELLKDEFVLDLPYVWPGGSAGVKGASVNPLYHTVPRACEQDPRLYNLLALTDAIRVGNPQEKKPVVEKLASETYSNA
ncbi:MAG: hypothetical protein U5K31_06990 [Balneolaceae bacterium]|nr:hypothetical protein [Balneolaceae bacterium]